MGRIEPCKIYVSYLISKESQIISLDGLPLAIQDEINNVTLDIYNWLLYAICYKHELSDKKIVSIYEDGKISFRVITCCMSGIIFCQSLLKEINYPIDILSEESPFQPRKT